MMCGTAFSRRDSNGGYCLDPEERIICRAHLLLSDNMRDSACRKTRSQKMNEMMNDDIEVRNEE
jgi:hypothetical protein